MLSESERRLLALVGEIGALEQRTRAIAERAFPTGLTFAQFALLAHLVRDNGPSAPARLARTMGVTKQTMTSTLGRLEAQGFVAVGADPADRRAKLVALTPAGAAVHRVCLARLGPVLAVAGDAVPEGLVPLLLAKLELLRKALDAAAPAAR